ncbi:S8 family serine peptidase [Gordonia rhizosphera]|uniref:Peptidase S8 family protein n=1 Tax=Gordonia rhizosphera NBRC 16068 TaxID=1108045 RepID=K6VVD5_9ACTN|nr:S8 family serine peptidase [Gordonia rhizosphera]GAB90825.1 peptidase S8 family protein [Gordonia rhizosphera NBRC 16068]
MISDDTTNTDPAETTGRQIITFTEDSTHDQRVEALQQVAGINTVASSDGLGPESVGVDDIESADATILERLGVAVADVSGVQLESLGDVADVSPVIIAIEPEHVVHALAAPLAVETHLRDGRSSTWGLQATRATTSQFDGTGVNVAVLDTGFDLNHPDFAGRTITTKSFITGQNVQDGNGHGTHCVGTSCGPKRPGQGPRYGVAAGANIFVGKVLSNQGSGSDTGILAGIEWALANRCAVISMSLGANNPQPVRAYEEVGRRALAAGSLIIAAAGNNAARPGNPGFVGSPANSPSILAVAALASDLRIASFSARATTVEGGAIDIAAPGVDVYSSWPLPDRYNTISGTSMATPHVAGIAALIAQSTGKRGQELWKALINGTEGLMLPKEDVGSGLAVAP